jgi:hypothetical protein
MFCFVFFALRSQRLVMPPNQDIIVFDCFGDAAVADFARACRGHDYLRHRLRVLFGWSRRCRRSCGACGFVAPRGALRHQVRDYLGKLAAVACIGSDKLGAVRRHFSRIVAVPCDAAAAAVAATCVIAVFFGPWRAPRQASGLPWPVPADSNYQAYVFLALPQ